MKIILRLRGKNCCRALFFVRFRSWVRSPCSFSRGTHHWLRRPENAIWVCSVPRSAVTDLFSLSPPAWPRPRSGCGPLWLAESGPVRRAQHQQHPLQRRSHKDGFITSLTWNHTGGRKKFPHWSGSWWILFILNLKASGNVLKLTLWVSQRRKTTVF